MLFWGVGGPHLPHWQGWATTATQLVRWKGQGHPWGGGGGWWLCSQRPHWVRHATCPQNPGCHSAGWPGTGPASHPGAASHAAWGDLNAPSPLRRSPRWPGRGPPPCVAGWPVAPGWSWGAWLGLTRLVTALSPRWWHLSLCLGTPSLSPAWIPCVPGVVPTCPHGVSHGSGVPSLLNTPLRVPTSLVTPACPARPVSPTSHAYPLCVPRASPRPPPRVPAHSLRAPHPHPTPPAWVPTSRVLSLRVPCLSPHPTRTPPAPHVRPSPPPTRVPLASPTTPKLSHPPRHRHQHPPPRVPPTPQQTPPPRARPARAL